MLSSRKEATITVPWSSRDSAAWGLGGVEVAILEDAPLARQVDPGVAARGSATPFLTGLPGHVFGPASHAGAASVGVGGVTVA